MRAVKTSGHITCLLRNSLLFNQLAGIVKMANFQENLFKGRHGHSIRNDAQILQTFVKDREKVSKFIRVPLGNLHHGLTLNLSQFGNIFA